MKSATNTCVLVNQHPIQSIRDLTFGIVQQMVSNKFPIIS